MANSGEQFFDQSGMDRGNAFNLSGGAHDAYDPDRESHGDQSAAWFPAPVMQPPGQRAGMGGSLPWSELPNADRTGRMDSADDANGSNLCGGGDA